MRLILVRHGRPDESLGLADPPLNDAGRSQAAAVAALLSRERPTHLVSSPLRRARETGEPLARHTGLEPIVIDGWAEADRALSRYRSTETLRAQGEHEWARFLADPVAYMGADPIAFRQAVLQALDDTLALSSPCDREPRVVVFTHGLPINTVLSQALGLSRITHFPPWYGSVTRLASRPGQPLGIVSINETGHHALVPSNP